MAKVCPWRSTSFEGAPKAMVVIVYVSFTSVDGITIITEVAMGASSIVKIIIGKEPSTVIVLVKTSKAFVLDSFGKQFG